TPSVGESLTFLRALNNLQDAEGRPYASRVTYHGIDAWWCRQQEVYDHYLRPFLRYEPLLARAVAGGMVRIRACPPELRRILPFVAGGHRVSAEGPPERLDFPKVRRLASGALYRTITAAGLLRALVQRPEYLVYAYDALDAAGQNRWIGGLHEALARRGISFLEIVSSSSGVRALQGLRTRGRSVLHLQALAPRPTDAPSGGPPADSVPEELRAAFLRQVAERVGLAGAEGSCRTIARVERVLSVLRPAGVFLMDDPVHAWERAIACRRLGTPSVAVQHGQFGSETVGLMGYGYRGAPGFAVDRYCVWGPHFRDLIRRHGRLFDERAVVVAGSPRPAGRVDRSPSRSTEVVILLEHHDPAIRGREIVPYLRAMLDAGFPIRIKPHPAAAPWTGFRE